MISTVSLDALHARIGGVVHERKGALKSAVQLKRLSSIRTSDEGSVCFFFSKEFIDDLANAKPTVLVTSKPFLEGLKAAQHPLLERAWIIEVLDPYLALGQTTELFANESDLGFIHPSAVVDPSAKLGKEVQLGAHVVVGAGVTIGDKTKLFPHVVIYPGVKIGREVRIHANSTIGADGFGYAPIMSNGQPVGHQKIHHLGTVIIGDRVEIGANSSIDRGTLDDTIIEDDVKIDNNVQVGHNCLVKKGAVICGNAGLAGSCTVGEFAMVAGAAGVSNKVVIGNYAKLGAMSIAMKDIPEGEVSAGVPQRSHRDFLRVNAWLNQQALKGSKNS